MRRVLLSIFAGLAGAGAVMAQGQLVNGLRAVVSDAVITDYQVRVTAGPAIDLLRARLAGRPAEFQSQASKTIADALEQLVERQLIVHEFDVRGYSLPDKIVDEILQSRIKERYGDRQTFIKTLRAEGSTVEKMRRQIREQIIINAMLDKNVSSLLVVSPYKVESYYQAHLDEFRVEDRVRLRLIMLDQSAAATIDERKALAQEILRKIKHGASFAEMAALYSTGSHRTRGGEWGWATRTELFKGLADIAFELEPGTPGPVIGYAGQPTDYWVCTYDDAGQPLVARHFATDPDTRKERLVEERRFEGSSAHTNSFPGEVFYLVLVEEKSPAHVKPLSEVRDEIEKTLLAQGQETLRKKWIETLKKKTFVRYF